jgi:hypothetical protein
MTNHINYDKSDGNIFNITSRDHAFYFTCAINNKMDQTSKSQNKFP